MTIEQLKKQARQHEQNEDWGRALEFYRRVLDETEDEGEPEISLYNRVADLEVRVGNVESAVEGYERAIDLYLEADLPNNAMAICRKVLRNMPDRPETFLRMGQIRARQGFGVEARQHVLTYAELMQARGDGDAATKALEELVELFPGDAEARVFLGERLVGLGALDEGVAHLLGAWHALETSDGEEAEGLAARIRELDPEADFSEPPAALRKAGQEDGDDDLSTFLGGAGLGDPGGPMEAILEGEDGRSPAAADDSDAPDLDAPGTELAAIEFTDLEFTSLDAEGEGGDPDRGEGEERGTGRPSQSPAPASSGEAGFEFGEIALGEASAHPEPGEGSPGLGGLEDGEPEDGEREEAEPGSEGAWGHFTVDEPSDEADGDLGGELPSLDPLPSLGSEPAVEFSSGGPAAGPVEEARAEVQEAQDAGDRGALLSAMRRLALALEAEDDLEGAALAHEQVLQLDPRDSLALQALGRDAPAGAGSPEGAPPQGSGGFVDLGALVLDDREAPTTRWVVEDDRSGDEAADFALMLSRFKAKVAENITRDDARSSYDLGTAYREMGLMEEAIAMFQQALRAQPGHLASLEMLGQCFLDREEPQVAIRVLDRAVRLGAPVEDDLLGIYYFLGLAHERSGNRDEALEFYEKVFALDINFKDVTDRLRVLR